MPSLLIVDDDHAFLNELSALLRRDYEILTATTAVEAKTQFASAPDAVLLDVRLSDEGGNKQGLELLDTLCETLPDVPVVMMTSFSDVDIAVECMQRGALDFIQKSRTQPKEIKARLNKVLQTGRVAQEAAQSKREIELLQPGGIVANSAVMMGVKRKIAAFANGRINVLILGETGVGKEPVAKAIHKLGPRSKKPYKRVDLSYYSSTIIESELFGHVAGAYTDAQGAKMGVFEQANGGVLFLDEIGNIPMGLQIKLLRVLQEREFERMGEAGKPIKLDVQFVFATNADLEQKIADKEFRQDFYQRIKAAVIEVPTLRERAEDVRLLADHFIKANIKDGSSVRGIVPEALDLLTNYAWPGNVRQLENTIESASALAESRSSSRIEPEDLESLTDGTPRVSQIMVAPVQPTQEIAPAPPTGDEPKIDFAQDNFQIDCYLARQELIIMREGIERWGTKVDAARHLGYSGKEPRFALQNRLKRHGENWPVLKTEFADLYGS